MKKFLINNIRSLIYKIIDIDSIIDKIIDNINKKIDDKQKKRMFYSIKWDLQKQALDDTTFYVSKNMSNVKYFSNRYEIMDYIFKDILCSGMNLEFGVWKGESINYFAKKYFPNIIYGFDSFEGLPEFWRNGFEEGCFSVGGKLPEVEKNVVLIKGWFNESLPLFLETHKENISFLHIDCDLYSSTKIIFDLLGDKIQKGTIILFDEYFNYPLWKEGEYKAFQEFVSQNRLNYEYICYNQEGEQVALRII